ncbi:hypothetical protein [Rhodoluna sp.]|uniref:hypothetical protein n=1 Tax=Rhodoluna sp. TaxID=1969481 RepID=UPI0025E572AD|nr:hypothetical protein [Rhodoluna sp.]
MSKNISRKGIAFGVAATVGFAGLTGALPAQAVVPVSLSPNAGTSYGQILGQTFNLKSVFTDAAQVGSEDLTFKIVDSTSSLAVGDFTLESASTHTYSYATGNEAAPASNNVVLAADDAALEAGDTFSVQVTAFLDYNGDGELQTTGEDAETASATRTVTFYAVDEVTSTVSVTQPYEGDNSIAAAVKFTNINNEQLDETDFAILFSTGTGGNLAGSEAAESTDAVSEWDATDGFTAETSGAIDDLVEAKVIKAQALYTPGGVAPVQPSDVSADTKVGSFKTAKVAAVKASSITADTVASKTANTADFALTNSEFQVSALVEDANDDAVAGNKVLATVSTDVTLSSTVKLIVNGVTYTDNDDLPGADGVAEVSSTSNAKGLATVSIKTVGFAAEDVVSVEFSTENLPSSTVDVALQDAEYSIVESNNIADLDPFEVATTPGGRFSLNVLVNDQFGGVPANGKYEARLSLDAAGTRSGDGEEATNDVDSVVAVSNGKASFTVTDNGTGTGVDEYAVDLWKKSTADTIDTLWVDVNLVAAADLIAGDISVDGSDDANEDGVFEIGNDVALEVEDFSNFDARTLEGTEPNLNQDGFLIAGIVSTAGSDTEESVAVIGATVTISGEGLLFESSGNYSVGSLAVRADDEGNYDFNVWSHKAGEQTVTIKSGSKSQKVIIEFGQADDEAGTNVAFTSSNQVKAGRTLTVKGLLTDKFGNPVNTTDNGIFEAIYDGPGFILSDDVIETDANGKFSIKVLLGTGEVGSASVTAKYDVDGDLDVADEEDNRITKTQTILLGVSAASVAGSKKVVSTVKNASGLQVKVYVDGKLKATKTASSDNYSVAVSKLTVGKHTVKVYVAGILVNTKSVVVKK